ncbi:hypothetical protein [Halorhabdus sp. CUG00001]|uniref:hypothetical protein n=1 Tax=Halorhabdus sp. CUG00001 TaxID=2600297 RepID=UPI00131CC411|nr:hypothetical protein [Halorhabdus sp. CUG00001]
MPESAVGKLLWAGGVSFVAFLAFVVVSAAFAAGSPLLGMGLVLATLLGYWAWVYRDETDSAAETAEMVGDEAAGFFGGLVDWVTALVLSVGVIVISVGGGIFDLVDMLTQLFWIEPITATTALVAGLIAYGAATGHDLLMIADINGTPGLQTEEWAVIAFALVVIAVLARRYAYGKARNR